MFIYLDRSRDAMIQSGAMMARNEEGKKPEWIYDRFFFLIYLHTDG